MSEPTQNDTALEETCEDCDKPDLECRCEGRLRCSCGVPILACPCAYETTQTQQKERDDARSHR